MFTLRHIVCIIFLKFFLIYTNIVYCIWSESLFYKLANIAGMSPIMLKSPLFKISNRCGNYCSTFLI